MPKMLACMTYVLWILICPVLMALPKLRGGWRQRMGHLPKLKPAPGLRVWLHGASAGDVLALAPTAAALRDRLPNCEVLISSITSSGIAMAKAQSKVFDHVIYAPWDLPHTTRRAVARLNINLLVLEYTELWPQLIAAAEAARVPIALHNGRIGHDRLFRYRLLFFVTGNLLRKLSVLLMRDEVEAARAIALGAKPDRVHVTGNTKFDNALQAPNAALTRTLISGAGWSHGPPVWVAGSTHEGEEEALLRAHLTLRLTCPDLVLIIAPRYPERAAKVLQMARRLQLRAGLRQNLPAHAHDTLDVLVLDTVGELTACYAMARVVFVGGSFVPRGGQNILEPAAMGRPVLFGPHMHNFGNAVAVLLGRGGIQVRDVAQLERVLADLLPRVQVCAALGEVAQTQVLSHRGAASRNAAALVDQLAAIDTSRHQGVRSSVELARQLPNRAGVG